MSSLMSSLRSLLLVAGINAVLMASVLIVGFALGKEHSREIEMLRSDTPELRYPIAMDGAGDRNSEKTAAIRAPLPIKSLPLKEGVTGGVNVGDSDMKKSDVAVKQETKAADLSGASARATNLAKDEQAKKPVPKGETKSDSLKTGAANAGKSSKVSQPVAGAKSKAAKPVKPDPNQKGVKNTQE